ncbi:hypothetical protein FVF72_09150 [Methanothermobacter sp. KEPCO-1]|uniref:hypothetical protein n=1 Tax=Methanothermobacter sp. KEPCO-1 TaxID=2603820 RepID=UPI0011C8459D|nr:hypothetical protein [Methanothermobacter sp. KEPCO-1]QEF93685.1 hypothetical protein FVF72_00050 [Methanothermobacter sp. KEPCO-1]QEF95299.1 hypothetical protein FVF72_09150 [Methanothermobacter sp. KEPCO-1]
MKMNESTFVDMLCEKLEDKLDGLTVSKMENLIYKVIVNEDLEFEPNPKSCPSTGKGFRNTFGNIEK